MLCSCLIYGSRVPHKWPFNVGWIKPIHIDNLFIHVERGTSRIVVEKAFPAAPAARPAARSLGNLPNSWSFLDFTLLCSRGAWGRFYHIVWPFYVAMLISPYHGDLEKA